MEINYSYYATSKGYKVVGGTAAQFLKADGSLDATTYVNTDAIQNIFAIKNFLGSTNNTYTGAAIRIDGNGNTNTIFPTIAFHQPGLYAATASFRGDAYHFTNINGDNYESIKANAFINVNSDNNKILLGAGADKPLRDFVQTLTNNRVYLSWDGSQPWIQVDNTFIGYVATTSQLNGKVSKSGDTMTGNLTLGDGVGIYSNIMNGSQVLTPSSDSLYIGNSALPFVTIESLNLRHYISGQGYGTVWTGHNFNPAAKANAYENGTAIGFAAGQYPTQDGGYFPYMFFDNGTTQDYIALATKAHMNWRLDQKVNAVQNAVDLGFEYADINGRPFVRHSSGTAIFLARDSQLSDVVYLSTPQTIIADKSFAPTSKVIFYGDDNSAVRVLRKSGLYEVVSGHEYCFYNTRWLTGNKRGGSDNTLGYTFNVSYDDGANYSEVVRIGGDGIIYTGTTGNSENWQTAYNWGNHANAGYQPAGNYVRVGGTGTTNNNIFLGWTGSELRLTVDVTTIGTMWHTGNFNPANYVTTSSLNSTLTDYAKLEADQTFLGVNTFNKSPNVPDAQLPNHAVSLVQTKELITKTTVEVYHNSTGASTVYFMSSYPGIKELNVAVDSSFDFEVRDMLDGMTVNVRNATDVACGLVINGGGSNITIPIKRHLQFHMDSQGNLGVTDMGVFAFI